MSTGTLIGRDDELAQLEERARTNRLVTVVGPGGVGKTALARAAAERLEGLHTLGVRFVDLTRVEDEAAVPGAIADQLGFDSFDALLSSPNDRPVLLVVDNCEHLLDTAADVIVQVLGECQQPTILATSRSPLEVPGESILSLAPLRLPAGEADAISFPAVQLFLQRCRDAGANIADDDLPVVVDLCRRLDGLPLAIEIAAARARTMSVSEIATRLSESVEVLDRPRFRGDPRHRGVADTIRWSHDLLGQAQADVLEQLGVFAGPFTAAEARAIVRPDGAGGLDGDLDELVNASLVVADTTGRETRFRLLDTVRRFALDELRRHEKLDAAYDRFVEHVVTVIQGIVAGTEAVWRPSVVSELVAEFEDIAEALRWCIAHDGSPRRAYRLCSVLWPIVHQGHADDIAIIARRVFERWPADTSQSAARVTAVLATAEYVTGRPERALELAEPALELLDAPGFASVMLYRVLGQARRAVDDVDGALVALRAGASIGHELGMAAMAFELETAAAVVVADRGDLDRAIDDLNDVIARGLAIESVLTVAWTTTALGWVMLRQDPVAAGPVIVDALEQARRIDYPIGVAVGLRSRAYAELIAGDTAAAVDTATDLMRDLMQRGALSNGRILLDVTAAIACKRGHADWARLAATARSLPITTLVCAQFELLPFPGASEPPLARHDAIGAARNVLAELSIAEDAPGGGVTSPATNGASIRRLGDVYEFSFAGSSVTVRTARGIEDLLRLIEAEGREIHCLDLVGAAVDEPSTGEVIDVAARRTYEQRIRDLQEEIDEAENNSDHGLAYRHQAELDSLIEHLSAALGHGSRTRRSGGSAERARSAVTHRVRTTIRRLQKLHPRLGRHLSNSIVTGTYCSYRPEESVAWRIE